MPLQYPEDLTVRVRRLELSLDRLFTAVTSQPSRVQIGADDGPHIVLAVGEDGLPELRFYPDGGSSYARIVAGGSAGSGIEITGQADVSGNKYSLTMDEQSFGVFYRDGAGSQAQGAMLQATVSDAATGYLGSSQSDQNYWFQDPDHTVLVGRFEDGGAAPYWGILVGGGTVSGGSVTATYGPSMASDVYPIVAVEDTGGADFDWCLSAVSSTGFTVDYSSSDTRTVYFWVFRV